MRRQSTPTIRAYVALAQVYSDANRGAEAVKSAATAQAKFPAETTIAFELGAVFDKQKQFADAEAAFRQCSRAIPTTRRRSTISATCWPIAASGSTSRSLLKKALEIEPDNGSYLDSLGWAYYKGNKLDLAADNLKRAADQLKTNSVIQDHYGDVLFKLGRYDEAIAAWTRALAGDGDSIDRAGIDKKIRVGQAKTRQEMTRSRRVARRS